MDQYNADLNRPDPFDSQSSQHILGDMLVGCQYILGHMSKLPDHLSHGTDCLDRKVMGDKSFVAVLSLAVVVMAFEWDDIEQMHCLPYHMDSYTLEYDSSPCKLHSMHMSTDMGWSICYANKLYHEHNRNSRRTLGGTRYKRRPANRQYNCNHRCYTQHSPHKAMDYTCLQVPRFELEWIFRYKLSNDM